MNVEIGTVAAQFLLWEYLFRIFNIGSLQCGPEYRIVPPCASCLTATKPQNFSKNPFLYVDNIACEMSDKNLQIFRENENICRRSHPKGKLVFAQLFRIFSANLQIRIGFLRQTNFCNIFVNIFIIWETIKRHFCARLPS